MSVMRLYAPEECTGRGGYPPEWHASIKDQVREDAGHRCVRCGHPYRKGDGEWSRCDEHCSHAGPYRVWLPELDAWISQGRTDISVRTYGNHICEAQWRVLTVHHFDGIKGNCRWWNLAALCQRCHLEIQGKVRMDRRWLREHSPWFRPYVAGFYAWDRLGEDLSREEVSARLQELLALEDRQLSLEGAGA